MNLIFWRYKIHLPKIAVERQVFWEGTDDEAPWDPSREPESSFPWIPRDVWYSDAKDERWEPIKNATDKEWGAGVLGSFGDRRKASGHVAQEKLMGPVWVGRTKVEEKEWKTEGPTWLLEGRYPTLARLQKPTFAPPRNAASTGGPKKVKTVPLEAGPVRFLNVSCRRKFGSWYNLGT